MKTNKSRVPQLKQNVVVGRSEQLVAVDCTHCGRLYKDTMCKLHPALCKK